jgi:hypothetical protein
MKSEAEITRAHDILVGVILKELPMELEGRIKMLMRAQADVLCWVLEHDHNNNFQRNFEAIVKVAEAAGYKLVRKDN